VSEDVFGPSDSNRRRRDGWARFLARMSDILLLVLPGSFIIGIGLATMQLSGLLPGPDPEANPLVQWGINMLIGLSVSLFLESLLLSSWGTTPGKWLMGVKVRTEAGEKLSFPAAAKRWLLVFVIGRGLGIPIVSLITLFRAAEDLQEEGITTWDEMMDLTVTRRQVNALRWTLGVLLWLGMMALAIAERVASMMGKLGAGG
jgi:uncharacterized RDD family membrane protein YckC